MKVWIDIENPPQVQYLSPFERAFEERGDSVIVTARDSSITLELLRQRGSTPLVVDAPTETSKLRKLAAIMKRAARLRRALGAYSPDVVIGTSRSGSLAARAMRIPCFSFCDYEFVDLRAARLTRAYVLHPDVIPMDIFLAAGFRADRLIPFPGLKEAISFSSVDLAQVEPLPLPAADRARRRVLFRPPGESTHYFVQDSLQVSLRLLAHLSQRPDVVVVYAPRDAGQVAYVDRLDWVNPPIVLERGVSFISLLAAVDAVVSAGGTMLREAAYLGIPAFSVFRSEVGHVDHYLQSIGRLRLITSDAEFAEIGTSRASFDPLPKRSASLVGDIVDEIARRANRESDSGAVAPGGAWSPLKR